MTNSRFHTAISAPRFNRYLWACGHQQSKATRLYRINLLLSQRLYAIVGIFEIVLRNSIDRHFISTKGPFWLEEAVMPGGYLDITIGCEISYHSVQEAIHNLGIEYTHDHLLTKLSFGFWTYQFSRKEYAAAGNSLLQIFPQRPPGTRQKDVFKYLVRVNGLRNRIAHYEPLCFDKETGAIAFIPIQKRYELILELFTWLGCEPSKLLYGIDGVQKVIDELKDFAGRQSSGGMALPAVSA